MAVPNEDERRELAQALLIGIQVLKWDPPKEFFKRQGYEQTFATRLVEKLIASGWELKRVPKNIWTSQPL